MDNGNDQPAFHVWKFLMKNMIPTNSGLILYHNTDCFVIAYLDTYL